MDQSAANVAEKTQKPENDENHKYRPQHNFILFRLIALGNLFIKCMFAPERLQLLNFLSELFLGSAEFVLESAQKFLILPFGKRKVIVGQLTVLLFQFASHFIPTAFEL